MFTSVPLKRRESPTVHEAEHDIVVRRQRVTPKCVEMKRGGSSPPRRLEVRCSIQLSYRRVRHLRYNDDSSLRSCRSYAEVPSVGADSARTNPRTPSGTCSAATRPQ